MKAILRTWDGPKATFEDRIVTVDNRHDFLNGPYADTVPFAVGSNQEILPIEENENAVDSCRG